MFNGACNSVSHILTDEFRNSDFDDAKKPIGAAETKHVKVHYIRLPDAGRAITYEKFSICNLDIGAGE